MITAILSGVFALIGVTLGITSQWVLERIQKKAKEKERMIELYADWISAIDQSFSTYIHQQGTPGAYSHIENRIRLFEEDESVLAQIDKVHQCFPELMSPEFDDMNFKATQNPEWDDPKFRGELNILIKMVKKNSNIALNSDEKHHPLPHFDLMVIP